MNIQKMLKQAQKMQAQMASLQQDLAQRTCDASSGGGKVTAVANCAGDLVSLRIAPDVVDPADPTLLEDLVLAAVNQALARARELQQAEMQKLTSGLGLPPGLGF